MEDFDRERFRTFLGGGFPALHCQRAPSGACSETWRGAAAPDIGPSGCRTALPPGAVSQPDPRKDLRTPVGLDCFAVFHGAVPRGPANETRFVRLQIFLTGEPGNSYRHLAEELRMSEGALKVAAHRLRRRYGELLREEIAQTVAWPKEIKAELNHL